MERRNAKRKTVHLSAEFVSGGKYYSGVIGNISEYGLYIKTSHTKTDIDFLPTSIIELQFRMASDETIRLQCEIIWLYSRRIQLPRKEDGNVLENDLGMEIRSASSEYKNFILNL